MSRVENKERKVIKEREKFESSFLKLIMLQDGYKIFYRFFSSSLILELLQRIYTAQMATVTTVKSPLTTK